MQSILKQFPKWRFEIERLYLESADFRELCQDYEEVRALLATWTESDNANQATITEYQTLLKDLEAEIMEDVAGRFETVEPPSPTENTRFAEQEGDNET